jgi:bacterioferritin-associated ferredoxin
MIICLCEAVSDSALKAAIGQGSRTVKQVGDACRAGTDCGACCKDIAELIRTTTGSQYRRVGTASRLLSAR